VFGENSHVGSPKQRVNTAINDSRVDSAGDLLAAIVHEAMDDERQTPFRSHDAHPAARRVRNAECSSRLPAR